MYTQCIWCHNLVARISTIFHECPQADITADSESIIVDEADEINEVGPSQPWTFSSITPTEFEGKFWRCLGCQRIVGTNGRDKHVCPLDMEAAINAASIAAGVE